MTSIPLSRATTLIPFVDFMAEIGAPVEATLERCHLPPDLSPVSQGYIPTLKNWQFVSEMARSQGVEDLGLRVAHKSIREVLTRELLRRVLVAPTLLDAVRRFAHRCRRESSGMRVWLSGRPDHSRVHLEKTFGTETPGFRQTEWLGLMTIVEIIRLYAGESWQPDLISLRAPGILPVLGSELFPHAQILSGQTSTYLTIDTHLLGLGPSDCASRLISRIGSDPKVPASTLPSTDLVGSLRQVLETYLQTGYPSLELASEITGLRPRTLQRRLREAGLSYKTLIDNTRFEVASRLLVQSNVRAIDITYATGYRDPSHFSRAFRRIAGCSPLQYRDHFSSPKKPLASRAR